MLSSLVRSNMTLLLTKFVTLSNHPSPVFSFHVAETFQTRSYAIFRPDQKIASELVAMMRSYGDLFHVRTLTTPYCLKSIAIFPVAKLQTLRFVGFIDITSRCTYILVTNFLKHFIPLRAFESPPNM